MELKLINFIVDDYDWEYILKEEPYCLDIKKENYGTDYIMFNYNQITSDFSDDIVKEARGIILEADTLKPACVPFFKFFNIDEDNADKIDWSTAKVQEKIDGSLIKMWFNPYEQKWMVSTNRCINAFSCKLPNNLVYDNFGELFLEAINNSSIREMDLNTDYTYMFELVSPYNKVVIDYPEIKIYHIGTRNNKTLKEIDVDIGVEKPKEYDLKTEAQVRLAAQKLPFNEEGYVVVDKNYNRVKVKSPAYVNAHILVNNHTINKKKVLELILRDGQSEFLSYFPEYKEIFKEIYNKLETWKSRLNFMEMMIKANEYARPDMTDKQFALFVQELDNKEDCALAFQLHKNKIKNWKEYVDNLPIKKILEKIERVSLYE